MMVDSSSPRRRSTLKAYTNNAILRRRSRDTSYDLEQQIPHEAHEMESDHKKQARELHKDEV
jgi:hypothetical protein